MSEVPELFEGIIAQKKMTKIAKKMCMIVKDKAKFRNLNGIRTINP